MERFWEKVDKQGEGGCWVWIACLTRDGYGRFLFQGRVRLAHRFLYEQMVGAIPSGLTIDHLCRNRLCVNPAHLEPVANRENILRGYGPAASNARKTHCVHGHPFDSANTYITPKGFRICRTCRKACVRRYKVRRALLEAVR